MTLDMSNYTFLDTILQDVTCRLTSGYSCNTTLQPGLDCQSDGQTIDLNCNLNIDIQNETSYSCDTCYNQTMDSASNYSMCNSQYKLNMVTMVFESALKSLWLRIPVLDICNLDSILCFNDYNRTFDSNFSVLETFQCSLNFRNGTGDFMGEKAEYDWSFLFVILFIIAGGVGNILVCLAVCLDKRLQNVTNYFLLSLAIADLLVSLFVMPMGAIPGFLGTYQHFIDVILYCTQT